MATEICNPRLKQRDDGVFEIRFTEKAGKVQRSRAISTRRRDLSEAQKVYQSWLAAEQAAVSSTLTLAEILAFYLTAAAERGSTCWASAARMVTPHLGAYYPHQLTEEVLRAYRRQRGISVPTFDYEMRMVRAACHYAAAKGKIGADAVPKLIKPTRQQKRHVFLSEARKEEWIKLVEGTNNGRLSRLYLFSMIGLETGARKTAIETLTWHPQVNFDTGLIDFRIGGAETNKRRAVVPMSKRLEPILRQAYAERTSNYVLGVPTTIADAWDALVDRSPFASMPEAGGRKLIRHDLRRTFATLLVMKGKPIAKVAQLLGDTVSTTERTYLIFAPSHDLRSMLD